MTRAQTLFQLLCSLSLFKMCCTVQPSQKRAKFDKISCLPYAVQPSPRQSSVCDPIGMYPSKGHTGNKGRQLSKYEKSSNTVSAVGFSASLRKVLYSLAQYQSKPKKGKQIEKSYYQKQLNPSIFVE